MTNSIALANNTDTDIHIIPDVAEVPKDFACAMFAGQLWRGRRLSAEPAFCFFHETPERPPEIIAFQEG